MRAFNLEKVRSQTFGYVSSLDGLLAQSCISGSLEAAYKDLKGSEKFTRQDTLQWKGSSLRFRVDKITGCRSELDEEGNCYNPEIEKNGTEIVVPACG